MKKFLSLVLALVMTMSLVTVSAGAEDFTDAEDITYVEAVEVMEAINVVDGDTAGNFNPTNGLTRGAAAKIICNMILGPTTAAALNADTDPFSDVDKDSTFAGYIAYCAKEGIVGGYADGTFKPAAPLTGYAFMKMLLGALGYDAAVEGYTGANWSINVAKRAINLGLNNGLVDEFNGSAYVTREEAMLYAFNTLQATMVEYDAKTSVSVGGAEVIIAGSDAEEVYGGDNDIKADNKLQFAEKYFGNLKKLGNEVDAFNRPATTWKIKNVKVGTYTETPDVSYTENVKLGTIYADLGLSSKITATVYNNGDVCTNPAVISKGNTTKLNDTIVNAGTAGYGTLVDVYYDADAETIDIILVQTYVGEIVKVAKANDKKDAYVVVGELTASPLTTSTDEFETDAAFAEDEIVLFTYSDKDDELQSVVAAESVTGTMTGRNTGKSVTIDGEKYNFSFNYLCDPVETMLEPKNDYVVYVDSYGNAIYVKAVEEISSDFALVNAIQSATGLNQTNRAQLYFTDGTKAIVELAKDYLGDYGIAAKDIVTFRVNDDGKYVLQEVSASKYIARNNTSTFALRNGNASVQMTYGDNAYANSKTILVVENNADKLASYTGIKNMPSIFSNGQAQEFYAYCATGNDGTPTLTYAWFLSAGNAHITTGSTDVIFIAKASNSGELDLNSNEDYDYYTYNAVVNGEITTVNVDAALDVTSVMTNGVLGSSIVNGLFKDASYDKDVIVGLTDNGSSSAVTGTTKLDGEYTVGLNSVKYTVADDAKIYTIDGDGVISEVELKNIQTDDNDKAWFLMDDTSTYIEYLFVQEVADNANDNTVNGGNSIYTVTLNKVGTALTVAISGGDAADSTTTWSVDSVLVKNLNSDVTTEVDGAGAGTLTSGAQTATSVGGVTVTANGLTTYQIVLNIGGELVASNVIFA